MPDGGKVSQTKDRPHFNGQYPYAGGRVGGAIPTYRLPQAEIDQDVAILDRLGVEIRYGIKAGVDFTLSELREESAG